MTTPHHRAALARRRAATRAGIETALACIYAAGLLVLILAIVEAIQIGSGA